MDKHLRITAFLFLAVVSIGSVAAQSVNLDALRKDYPLLTERYADKLQSRNAHYIFAIDISSSMLTYEKVVKESLMKFLDAVPNGDQISIVVMADENNTNYLDAAKCITLNDKMRRDIKSTLNGHSFAFKKNGDQSDGSDGFMMAKRVLEAMNVVNSSELTFVYLLTDFEYWTHKNRYDKSKEDWASLKPMLTDKHRGMLCKYGIELTFNKPKHGEAMFKEELDGIFGPLDYQPAASAGMLEQWFGHIINDIQAHKINAMLKADWSEYQRGLEVGFRNDGRKLKAVIAAPGSDLVSGVRVTLEDGRCENLSAGKECAAKYDDGEWTAEVGRYVSEPTVLPSFLRVAATDARVRLDFESPYAEEINKLQGLCQENGDTPDAVRMASQEYAGAIPALRIWNARMPWWVYVLIVLAAALLIGALIYMLCVHPDRRYTAIVVKRKANGTSKQYNGETDRLPITVGRGGDANIPEASWTLKIYSRNRYPVFSWLSKRKMGYYAKLEDGDFAEIINDFTDEQTATLSTGKSAFLFKYKKAPNVRIEIAEGTTTNRIEIS